MHEPDFNGERHAKQMRDARNDMILDVCISMMCLAAAVSLFFFLEWLCGRYQ